jgi:hypothetical protein
MQLLGLCVHALLSMMVRHGRAVHHVAEVGFHMQSALSAVQESSSGFDTHGAEKHRPVATFHEHTPLHVACP